MNQPKHTKGPWTRGKSTHGRVPGATQPPAIIDSESNYIAVLGGGSIHFRNAEPNARLIVSAPTMYDALQDAPVPLVEGSHQAMIAWADMYWTWFETQRRAAIRKATGEGE